MTRTFFALENHLDTGRWRIYRFLRKADRDTYCLISGATPVNSSDARVMLGQNRFCAAGERWWHTDDAVPGSTWADIPKGRRR